MLTLAEEVWRAAGPGAAFDVAGLRDVARHWLALDWEGFSLPGVDGSSYGGVVANVPLRQARDMGARSLVVLDCAFAGRLPEAPGTLAEVLLYTGLVTMRAQAVLDAPLVAESVPVVYIPGPEPLPISTLDFDHTSELIEGSYEAARSFLEQIEITGPGLYGSPSL